MKDPHDFIMKLLELFGKDKIFEHRKQAMIDMRKTEIEIFPCTLFGGKVTMRWEFDGRIAGE